MQLLHAIPALPVRKLDLRLLFYRDMLGFMLVYHEGGFAILRRDAVELHLWEANDERWRTRQDGTAPVVSGAESFIAGTASCRVAVAGVDALYAELLPHGIIHPNAPLTDQPWGLREFGVLDPDNNLITFFEMKLT